MKAMEYAVHAEQLHKVYSRKVTALDGVSVAVPPGEIFGIIGPDGAGKTTLFRVLTTLLLPDQGKATVLGLDVVSDWMKIRERVGYMPGRFSLYQDLTVEENLAFFATVFRTTVAENYEFVKDIYQQIEPFRTRRVSALSGGMKQKLALCCALIHRPSVLFLDEPTTGVDPVSRKEFWQMLQRLKTQGVTLLVSTPYMDEAKQCDRIALMQHGQFLQTDSPTGMMENYPGTIYAVRSDRMSALLQDLRAHPSVKSCFAFGDTHHVTFREDFPGEVDLMAYLEALQHHDLHLTPIPAGVEDCFLRLTENT